MNEAQSGALGDRVTSTSTQSHGIWQLAVQFDYVQHFFDTFTYLY